MIKWLKKYRKGAIVGGIVTLWLASLMMMGVQSECGLIEPCKIGSECKFTFLEKIGVLISQIPLMCEFAGDYSLFSILLAMKGALLGAYIQMRWW